MSIAMAHGVDRVAKIEPIRIPPQEMRDGLGRYQLRKPDAEEMAEAHRLGEALIGGELAPIARLEAVDARSDATVWITGEGSVTGIFLLVPLTRDGVHALYENTYDPVSPADDHVALPGAEICGLYCGIYAGATHEARRSIMQASAYLCTVLYADVPIFARAATPDGARSMTSLGFGPAGFGLPDLYMSWPETRVKA